jgi:hypothetical protein
MKIALINNYDMRSIVLSREQEGLNAPAQHLWGLTGLPDHGIEVDIVDFQEFSFLKKFSDKIKLLGDLDQQFKLLFKQNRYAAVYSAHHLPAPIRPAPPRYFADSNRGHCLPSSPQP